MKRITTLLILALAMLTIVGCAQSRFNRLVRKHPHLIDTKYETVTDTVTVTVDRVERDTVALIEELRATITLTEDRLTVEVYTVHDSVYIKGSCDSIIHTEYIDREVKVLEYRPTKKSNNNWLIIALAILVITSFIIKLRK